MSDQNKQAKDAEFTEEEPPRVIKDAPAMAAAENNDKPDIITLPPNILLLSLIAGLVLNWVFPYPLGHLWGWLGLALLIASGACMIWCKKLFDEAGTNIRPDMPSLALVEDGPYQYSRNPIYLCFLTGYAGLAMLADAPAMFLCLPVLWYVLDRYIIQPEEEYLAEKFGGAYLDYTGRVGRWIGVRSS
ncbi:MAG: hypothetical protein CMH27_10990 [Micavibrio sp.]|nr:hypothetical protein [Micavibrio sp.]|tara:strand:- start:370 stop:933 length:564 start_codon:yes stop_codon:yes gene_type:complete